jgi:signal peptidase I
MPGRERDGFVEEEQLGPAPPAHDLAAHPPKFTGADDPGLVSPATFQQRARGRVVDDAAVTREQATLFDGDDVAEGSDAILQRHSGSVAGILARMNTGRLLGRLALVFGVLLLGTACAMYYINPFNSASKDPRARILGHTLYRMPSRNMEPTLQENDIFIVSVATLRDRDPRVGEIIAFRFPPNPEVHFIDRVIGTGGSIIEMRAGKVFLDGMPLREPYLPAEPIFVDSNDTFGPVNVPQGQFFVLGDNRGNSLDSRFWGTVPRDHVIGVYQP